MCFRGHIFNLSDSYSFEILTVVKVLCVSAVTFSGACCAALRYATLRYALLRHAALRCVALRCATLCYATLRYAALRHATLHCATLRCATLRCTREACRPGWQSVVLTNSVLVANNRLCVWIQC